MHISSEQAQSLIIFEHHDYPIPPLDLVPFPKDEASQESKVLPAPTQPSIIEGFLAKYGIVITEKHFPEESDLNEISFLLDTITEDYSKVKNLFRVLRNAVAEKKGKFIINTQNYSGTVAATIRKVLYTMQDCGIFCELRLPKESGSFSGRVASSIKVQEFIKGTWLELFSQKNGIEVIKKKARDLHLPYEVLSNVKVRNTAGKAHEIDMMFAIGDKVFALEQKSGTNFCNYDNFRNVIDYLHLTPDRFMIVNSCISDKSTEKCIKYFHRYYICNSAEYTSVLSKMIDEAFRN